MDVLYVRGLILSVHSGATYLWRRAESFPCVTPTMNLKRKSTFCEGTVMVLLLGHMTATLEVPLDREYQAEL